MPYCYHKKEVLFILHCSYLVAKHALTKIAKNIVKVCKEDVSVLLVNDSHQKFRPTNAHGDF